MEVCPVDPPVMSLQHMFDHSIGLTKQVRSVGVGLDMILQTPSSRTRGHGLLPEARDVPDPDSLVQTGADHQVLAGVELGAHHVVVVPRQHADALPGLPVPDPDCLIVTGRQDPGIFVMEHRGSDVVKMTQQGEDTTSLLVVTHFDLVVIPPDTNRGCCLWKSTPRTGPSCSSNLSRRVHIL